MQDEKSSAFDINKYVRIIRKRRYMVISVAIGVLSLFTWGSFIWPKTYEASSTLIVDKSGIVNPLAEDNRPPDNGERFRQIQNIITSRSLIERVIKKLGIDGQTKNNAQYDTLIAKIQNNLTVTMGGIKRRPDPDLLTIAYRGRSPRTVMNFVDTLVKEFIVESAGRQQSEAIGTYDFIDEQLSLYKVKLEDSDKAIRGFREKHPEMIPRNEGTILGRIENYQTAQIDAEIRLKELLKRRENLQKQLSGEKEMTTAYISNNGSPEGRLHQLNNQLMLLLTKYTEDYPEVIKVRNEIEELRKQISQPATVRGGNATESAIGAEMKSLNPIYQQIKEDLSKTESEIDSLKARQNELTKQQIEERALLGRMPKEQEEWSKLQRDRNTYQRVYDELLQKRESARVSKDLESTDKTTRFRVVDPPVIPLFPVSPNRIMLILAGISLGIATGVGTAIGLENLDQSFKHEDDVRNELQLPVLAVIPSIVTEADVQAEARLDKKVYTASAVYLCLIVIVFVGELLYRYAGITILHF